MDELNQILAALMEKVQAAADQYTQSGPPGPEAEQHAATLLRSADEVTLPELGQWTRGVITAAIARSPEEPEALAFRRSWDAALAIEVRQAILSRYRGAGRR